MKQTNHPLNIIYLNIAEKGPSGGGKTIYYHSNLINSLKLSNISSEVLHIKKRKLSKWNISIKKMLKISSKNFYGWNIKNIMVDKNLKSKWHQKNVKLKKNLFFEKEKDFVIFPEIFAHFAKKLCIEKNIPYAIFVQNGYCLNSTNDYRTLDEVYKKAKFILSYSKVITHCIKLAFKNSESKILRTNISVDSTKFNFNVKKNNMITYMPRKLPTHSDNLIFFLRNNLPRTWKFKSIHNLSENDVYKILSKSKIFLSFSNMEGLGIPPIEAAIAGNKVIGYTGTGGSEYWKKPIFTEIPHGNINKFIEEIFKEIQDKRSTNRLKSSRKKIISKFSPSQEKVYIIKMINKIRSSKQ